jgi:hypothetical protein
MFQNKANVTCHGKKFPGPVNELVESFCISRTTGDRRVSPSLSAPYISEEGLVLIDRREAPDRRAANAHSHIL